MKSLCLIVLFLAACAAQETSAFEVAGGRQTGSSGLVDQADPDGADIAVLPTVRRPSGSWHFETGWDRRFNLKELDNMFMAADYRYRAVGLSLALSQFGSSDLYTERTIRSSLAAWYGPVGAAISLSHRQLDFNQVFPSLSASTMGGSLTLDLKSLLISSAVDNLTRPSFDSHSAPVERRYRLQAQILSERDFTFLGGLLLEPDKKLQFSFGQTIVLAGHADLLWSVSTRPWIYGGGLRIGWMATTFSYAVSYHPVLGLTHGVSVGLAGRRNTIEDR